MNYECGRLESLLSTFGKAYGMRNCSMFSAPGRIELCGNHTDHQNGKVLTAAINRDCVAVAAKNDESIIRVLSKGYSKITYNISRFSPASKNDVGNTFGIIHGIVNIMRESGYTVSGFDVYIESDIKRGSGVSSSAAIEVLLCTIINHLFNDGRICAIDIAKISQRSENEYFGKPCGLMDQAASACGGCLKIDFAGSPTITPVSTDMFDNLSIVLVNCGGSHAKLTSEYSAIVDEMHSVAQYFGKELLSQVNEDDFISSIGNMREKVSDRAILRAMHYFDECKRVDCAEIAIKNNDIHTFLQTITASGKSSANLLQNTYAQSCNDRSVALALALSERYFAQHNAVGAYRIHGGGFCGTILTIIDNEHVDEYMEYIKHAFDDVDSVKIRQEGGIIMHFE